MLQNAPYFRKDLPPRPAEDPSKARQVQNRYRSGRDRRPSQIFISLIPPFLCDLSFVFVTTDTSDRDALIVFVIVIVVDGDVSYTIYIRSLCPLRLIPQGRLCEDEHLPATPLILT